VRAKRGEATTGSDTGAFVRVANLAIDKPAVVTRSDRLSGNRRPGVDFDDMDFTDTIELPALESAGALVFINSTLLTTIDLSSLATLGTGGSDGFALTSNGSTATTGDLTVALPVAPVVVRGTVTITNNRRSSQPEALAIAAHFSNPGFPAAVVTNNRD